jgi:hypothetical protein
MTMRSIEVSCGTRFRCWLLIRAFAGFATLATGCAGEREDAAVEQNSGYPSQELPGGLAGPGSLVPPAMGPPRDSAHAVEIAQRVLYEPQSGLSLRVGMFTAADGGYLIRLLTDPAAPGGGGLVWVESDGSVRVLRRYR